MNSFHCLNASKMQEHLIIDGNNAMHAIPDLAKELRVDRSLARDSLLRFLEPLHSHGGSLLTVVFDGKGGPQRISKHRGLDEYTVVFSSSSEGADGVIERMLMAAKQPERLIVVTNDALIRNCAYEQGASAMRVEEVLKRMDHDIESANTIRQKPRFRNDRRDSFENRISFPGDFS